MELRTPWVLPASMRALEPYGVPRLSSWVTDGSASGGSFLPNRFLMESATDMMASLDVLVGLSADAQELRLLRQRLQVDFLPVRTGGIGVTAAKVIGGARRGLVR